jgi:capsular polysaccharide biosynthesis protein
METQVRPQRERPVPDVDAEDELEFGRYWNALLTRWWLPLAGLIGGIVLGYLLSLGGHQVYQAKATIYLGQPLSPNGTNPIQSLSTNPSAVKQVALSAFAQHEAETKAGLPSGSLAGHVATQTVATGVALTSRAGQNPLVSIIVTGRRRAQIAKGANALANIAIRDVSAGYVATKIQTLKSQVATQQQALKSIDATISALGASASNKSLGTTDRLILASQLNGQTLQRSQVVDQLAQYKQLLTLAQNVEQSKLFTPARAVKTTAKSRRNSVVVGALIGLLLGILAALLWEPVSRLARRSSL